MKIPNEQSPTLTMFLAELTELCQKRGVEICGLFAVYHNDEEPIRNIESVSGESGVIRTQSRGNRL